MKFAKMCTRMGMKHTFDSYYENLRKCIHMQNAYENILRSYESYGLFSIRVECKIVNLWLLNPSYQLVHVDCACLDV